MATAKSKTDLKVVPETDAPTTLPAAHLVGRFSFAFEEAATVPEGASKPTTANPLPFKEWFTRMSGALAGPGKSLHTFLPTSFWTEPKDQGGRGVPADKVTSGYVRAKVRGAFNEWVKAAEKDRAKYELVLWPRAAGDENGTFKEAGFSVYLRWSADAK